ncbi:hypothetical protein THAOC_34383 [Thalassiosira oceanica]|uniref:Uncharacterized protein n=1 Tax=Thalassiosira oceanica TaxID=159749 RepID=K0R2L7_THAOC|nr:hypothetical protein THAOC_34383 [Thalassiosira oceanica]|eukprot:EJK46928.1 hypothetical protein THAOC_34383 [Thalassiosira oceanica]
MSWTPEHLGRRLDLETAWTWRLSKECDDTKAATKMLSTVNNNSPHTSVSFRGKVQRVAQFGKVWSCTWTLAPQMYPRLFAIFVIFDRILHKNC